MNLWRRNAFAVFGAMFAITTGMLQNVYAEPKAELIVTNLGSIVAYDRGHHPMWTFRSRNVSESLWVAGTHGDAVYVDRTTADPRHHDLVEIYVGENAPQRLLKTFNGFGTIKVLRGYVFFFEPPENRVIVAPLADLDDSRTLSFPAPRDAVLLGKDSVVIQAQNAMYLLDFPSFATRRRISLESLRRLASAPNGKRVVAAASHVIAVYDEELREVWHVQGPTDLTALSTDGDAVYASRSGCIDGHAEIARLAPGKREERVSLGSVKISATAFSPSLGLLAAVGACGLELPGRESRVLVYDPPLKNLRSSITRGIADPFQIIQL